MLLKIPRRVLVALIVFSILLIAFVMSGCSQLSKKESTVDKKFSAMIPELNLRYQKLETAVEIAEQVGGERDVTQDAKEYIKKYNSAKKSKNNNEKLDASRELETIIGRLRANVATSPKLNSSQELAAAMTEIDNSIPGSGVRNDYINAVNAYEDARTSWRNLLSAQIGGFSPPSQLEFSLKAIPQ